MASIQLSGLISGLDWETFVDDMLQLQRVPITNLQTKQTENTSKISALNTLNSYLANLRTATKSLQGDGVFNARTVTSSNTAWTASATAGTATGTCAFNVTSLATASKLTGAARISNGLAASAEDARNLTLATLPTTTAVTAGTLTINGAKVTLAVTDSLGDVFDKIATATNNAVTAAYDPTTDGITLTSTDGTTPIVLGAANDTSNFLTVAKLHAPPTGDATSISSSASLGRTVTTTALANAGLSTPITAVTEGDGTGSFTLNGVQIDYNANTDSLTTLIKRINASGAGVTATYDSTNDSVVLTNNSTGSLGLTLANDTGGLLTSLGLTPGAGAATKLGDNAVFTLNGGPAITSTSNTLTAADHGITGLTLNLAATGSGTLTIGADTETMRSAIDTFVSAYNAVQSYIDTVTATNVSGTTVTSSTLSKNREVQNWASQLRSTVFASINGLDDTVSRITDLGLDFKGTSSQLNITDSAKLDAALRNNPDGVAAFFSTGSTGFAARLDTLLNNYIGATGTGGQIKDQTNALAKANAKIDDQIAALEKRIEAQRVRMEATFIAMESSISKYNQMQTLLENALGTNKDDKK
ncbi:flagellar filament capping protein FliD [Geminisphaera colitermitum]|uniref:flagellar filament capping protein FliD n=1 Tax=Geminisphaera colitermitum TaxID=1148786 RepID=UPI000158C751|nr:flagellar filament capping protein FliD [Geminisphaera colitermitum]